MFGNNRERTPAQRAQRAQLGIFARLAGCGYLIYIMVKMLQTPSETMPRTVVVIIAVVMLALSAFVIVITIREFIRGLQTGRYKAATYEEEELNDYLEKKASGEDAGGVPELTGEGEPDDEDEHDDDDEDNEDNEDDEDEQVDGGEDTRQ
jgi:flagellar biosynthesis/type III secretory pathway M-ring protein FliF/YscJ